MPPQPFPGKPYTANYVKLGLDLLHLTGDKPKVSHEKKTTSADRMCLTKHANKWPHAGGPVELSYAKGSVQEAARELGIDSIAPATRSDRGVQYACTESRHQLKGLPVVESMTGPPVRPKRQLLGQCSS